MRITDLPELSVADLAENDVVAVDHDTGNGIETRKFRVGKALANKLDKSGGEMTDYIRFGTHTAGLSWTLNNGDRMEWRPYVGGDRDVFQLVRVPGDGSMPQGYGILNVDLLDGKERIYASLNEKRDGYFPFSSIQKMDITTTLESTTSYDGTTLFFTLPEGYTVLNITLETVGWIGSVYVTEITTTSCKAFCAAVASEPSTTGAYKTVAHISMYKTFG